MPRRKLTLHADKLSFSDGVLQQHDTHVAFDDALGWDIEGTPVHADRPACDHCTLRRENLGERNRAYRAGVAFARFLDRAAPPLFLQGMVGFWAGDVPWEVQSSN